MDSDFHMTDELATALNEAIRKHTTELLDVGDFACSMTVLTNVIAGLLLSHASGDEDTALNLLTQLNERVGERIKEYRKNPLVSVTLRGQAN